MKPTVVWFVCAGATMLSGALFCSGFLYLGVDVLGFVADLMLVAATYVAIRILELLEQPRTNAERACILSATWMVLLIGVASKWQILGTVLKEEELRVLTPWLRIAYDAMMMAIVALFWMLEAAFKRHNEPYMFVKPTDRPRKPRVSPFE